MEYSYSDVPTIKAFAKDSTFIRAITGPFGSGKSSGCDIEIYRRAIGQEPSPDGVRKTRFAAVRNCYDDQTEILTEKRGWQLFKNLQPEDRVATLQGNNHDEIIYQLPDGISIYDYDGEMIGFCGEDIDFLVTPEHKMWVSIRRTRKKVWGVFESKTMEDIYDHYSHEHVRVRKDAVWHGMPGGFPEDWFELFGFLLAEGCSDKGGSITISNNNIGYVENLLFRNAIPYHPLSSKRQFRIYKNDVITAGLNIFLDLGRSHEKYIPQDIKGAQSSHLAALIKGFSIGDGNVFKGTTRLYTSSRTLANDLQEISIKAGLASNLASRDRRGKELIINGVPTKINYVEYIVTLLGNKKYRPTLKSDGKKTGLYKQDYHGKVYCVVMSEIPVCTRRRGNYFWALRSYPQL